MSRDDSPRAQPDLRVQLAQSALRRVQGSPVLVRDRKAIYRVISVRGRIKGRTNLDALQRNITRLYEHFRSTKMAARRTTGAGRNRKGLNVNETKQRFFDSGEVVGIAHERGLKHVTENTIKVAAYQKPIKLDERWSRAACTSRKRPSKAGLPAQTPQPETQTANARHSKGSNMSTSKIHEQDQQRAFVADLADKLAASTSRVMETVWSRTAPGDTRYGGT